MAGKKSDKRNSENGKARDVQLTVDGAQAHINGYVMDVFQNVVVGLVRSLGTEDASKRIEIVIGEEEGE